MSGPDKNYMRFPASNRTVMGVSKKFRHAEHFDRLSAPLVSASLLEIEMRFRIKSGMT